MRQLIRANARVSIEDENGWTPAQIATQNGFAEVTNIINHSSKHRQQGVRKSANLIEKSER